ncbi:hypothetical protein UPYG_G00063070 [Umbra pygmaea]|uniref:Platelet-derived growth factor (PDGF) family profile domain-containing protein n=1 Tax=Umbra pygmaea TaxID=75934 RepID=A0ABD0X9R4_UMBPY
MSSWVLLLLAALVSGCLRFGCAEGDPLPPSLVELVGNSQVSSMEELQHLLEKETGFSAEELEYPSSNDIHANDTHGRYKRNLVDAQPAQQAVCKVRTEVMEITRAMLDRRNANFMLWPPCVEVQRCSGCCNAKTLQCVPMTIQTRYLQVTRIQYIDKRVHYDKAVIPVEHHASCRCQPHPSSAAAAAAAAAARSTTLARSTPAPPPPRLTPKPPSFYKQDLHRHDDMKANQRFHLEDREQLERQWQSKYTLSHTQLHTHPLAGTVPRTHTQAHSGMQGGPLSDSPLGHGSGYDTHTATHVEKDSTVEMERQSELQQQQQHYQQQNQQQQEQQKFEQQQYHHQRQQYQPYIQRPELMSQYRYNAPQSDSSGPANHKPEQERGDTKLINERDSVTEVTNKNTQKDDEVTFHRQVKMEVIDHKMENDKERHSQTELANQEQRHTDSEPTNHKHLGSEATNLGDSVTEEDRRKKLLELLEPEADPKTQPHIPRPHLPHHQSLHRQSQTQTENIIKRPVPPTLSPSRAPSRPSSSRSQAPERPIRPALPRGRRKRKHRNRISKASLRAMIM